MKRKIASAVVGVGVLLSVLGSGSVAQAQGVSRPVADTGMVTLAPNQILRIVALAGDGLGTTLVGFRRIEYFQGGCNGGSGVCEHAVSSVVTTPPVTLLAGGAVSIDIAGQASGFRGVVLSNRTNLRVTAQLVDANTNQIIAILIGL